MATYRRIRDAVLKEIRVEFLLPEVLETLPHRK